MKRFIKLFVVCAMTVFAASVYYSDGSVDAQTQVLTAGNSPRYKNIQVLKDMPADQLGRVMNLWAASLGVDCDFCHNTSDFSKDEKKTKNTARQMVRMAMAINNDNFKGRSRVSCNTCHNGHEEPRSGINLNVAAEPERPKQPETKPSVDDILGKYYAGLGGKEKVDKITSRIETATRTERDGKEVEEETIYYADGKYAMKTVYPKATVTEAWDGTAAWKSSGKPLALRADEQEQIKREADVFSPASLKAAYTKLDFGFVDRIDGRDVNVLFATTASDQRERLYFDAETGLLTRRVMASQTIFGPFPVQVDYSDYKKFGGVETPTTIKYSMPNILWTRRILTVKNNAPVDASVFKAPAAG